jgi:hypothetical protein
MSPAQTMFSHLRQFADLGLSLRDVCVLYYVASRSSAVTHTEIAHALGLREDNGNIRSSMARLVTLGLLTRSTGRQQNNLPQHTHLITDSCRKLLRLPKPTAAHP